MSIVTERELYRTIKQGQYAPAYYLYGENDYLKDGAVRDLVAATIDPATRDFNFEQARGGDVTGEVLEVLLNTPPMMAARRVAVLRDVDALRRDARAVLDRYLAAPSPGTLLIVVAASDGREDKALISSTVGVEFGPLSLDRLPKWIQHYARSSLGAEVTEDAVELLVRVIGPDLPQLAAELEKLAAFSGTTSINLDAVRAVVGVPQGATLTDLLDAVASRDVARALDLLPRVMEQPKLGAVPILMALAVQTIAIAWSHAARARGLSQQAVERELFSLMKEARAYPARPWAEAVRVWARALPCWDEPSLDRALDALLDADRAAKETRLSSEEQLLSNAILAVCGTPHRAAA